MGFLSGVLGAVKDDTSVTTYYKGMETTLETFKKSMHKSDGLSKAVGAVREALGEWDTKVTEKTSALKNRLKTLNVDRFNEFDNSLKLLNSLLPEQLDQVPGQLQACITDAAAMLTDFNFAEAEYEKLDETLRDKLKNAMFQIKLQVEKFHGAATNTELRAVVEFSEVQMGELRTEVNTKSDEYVSTMAAKIDQMFVKQIKLPIEDVKRNLQSVFEDLKKWIERASLIAQYGIEQAGKILDEVQADSSGKNAGEKAQNWKKVEAAAESIKKRAQSLYEAASQVKTQIPTLVQKAKAAVEPFEQVYHKELKRIKGDVDGLVDNIKTTGLEQLDDKVKAGLEVLKGKFKDPIEKYFQKVDDALRNVTKGDSGRSHGTTTHLIQQFGFDLEGGNGEANALYKWTSENIRELANALDGIYSGDFEKIKTLVDKLLQPDNNSKKSFFGTIGEDVKNKVEGVIGNYEGRNNREFPKLMREYVSHKETNIQNKIEEIDVTVKQRFTGEQVDTTKVDPKLSGGKSKKEELIDAIDEINTKVVQDHLKNVGDDAADNKEKIGNTTFEDMLTQVELRLSELMSSINTLVESEATLGAEPSKGVKNYFQELQKIVQTEFGEDGEKTAKSLNGIKKRINDILNNNTAGNVTKIVTDAGNFKRNVIDKEADAAIESIKKFVDKQVAEKIRNIQGEARTLYHSKVSGIFNTMKTKVENYISNINDIIREDLRTGVKGLLRKVMDHDNKNRDVENANNALTKMKTFTPLINNDKFCALISNLRKYLLSICQYVRVEAMTVKPPVAPGATSYKEDNEASNKVGKIQGLIGDLLDHLSKANRLYNYDHTFEGLRDLLRSLLYAFSPSKYDGIYNATLLDALNAGLTELCAELDMTYVNRYSGATFEDNLLDGKTVVDVGKEPTKKYDLNSYGRKCSKVFLTLLRLLHDDMNELYEMCKLGGDCYRRKIYASVDVNANHLGDHLKTCGYRVASGQDCQDGELRCSPKMMGWRISRDILTRNDLVKIEDELEDEVSKTKHSILKKLYDNLHNYYEVCQLPIPSSKKHPSSVYQILLWFAGLTYNPVFRDLSLHGFDDLFEKPENADADQSVVQGISFQDGNADALEAHPHRVTAALISGTLTAVCHHAETTLIAFLGYGHSEGRYACDFNTNEEKLYYPSKSSDCIDMLMELANRAYHQLCFLRVQCERTYDSTSWRECYYGRGIGGSSWECNAIQYPNQKGGQETNQKGDQTCNQMGNQMADQNCRCGIKSPLQSFLEDGLPGFMAHSFIKPGCKLTCAAPNHVGKPCKTPMGLTDISVTGSHTKTGAHLAKILKNFCGKPNAPLALLCSYLTCVLQRTPQTLDDLFSFFYNMIKDWKTNGTRKLHKYDAFEDAVTKANFGVRYPELDINPLFKSSKHSHGSHVKGDLFSLYTCDTDAKTAIGCGRYLQPVGINIWIIFSNKNAEKYLSWVVYLTETFYDLLKKLYDDCCEKCNKPGARCHDTSCVKQCTTSLETTTSTAHEEGCRSIARCPYTRPTLYKYGFVFQSPYNLSGANEVTTKRTCKDFCRTLQRVLDKNSVLIELRQKIDAFLWTIRTPFTYLVLALWLLSLLYLIHIMVIRLDLLHIKSHLHSPSSHRIAAQSLLAAGRVNKLNRGFYLQP